MKRQRHKWMNEQTNKQTMQTYGLLEVPTDRETDRRLGEWTDERAIQPANHQKNPPING